MSMTDISLSDRFKRNQNKVIHNHQQTELHDAFQRRETKHDWVSFLSLRRRKTPIPPPTMHLYLLSIPVIIQTLLFIEIDVCMLTNITVLITGYC